MHVFGFSARPPTRFRCARREVVDTERADACDVGVAMSRARKSMRVVDGDAHSRRVRRAKIRKMDFRLHLSLQMSDVYVLAVSQSYMFIFSKSLYFSKTKSTFT